MSESYQMPRAEDEWEAGKPQEASCIACHSALPDKAASPHAELCPVCREHFIRYPFPKWLFAVLAVVLAINVATYFWFPQSMRDYARLKRADNLVQQKHFLQAAREYAGLAETMGSSGDIMEKQLDACMACGDLSTANDIMSYYAGRNVSDELYDKLTAYDGVFQRYGKWYQLLEGLYTEEMTEQEFLDKLTGKLGDADTDPMVLLQMAILNQGLGYDEQALEQINKALATGDSYLDGYTSKASILRRQGDFPAAEVCSRKALEANLDDVEAHRQLAVIHMLKKEYKAAVDEARTAYELEPDSLYVREAYANACHLAGDGKTRDAILAEMKTAGDPNIEAVEQLIAGQMTIESVYME